MRIFFFFIFVFIRASEETCKIVVHDTLKRYKVRLFSGRTDPSTSRSASQPCCAPFRPDLPVICLGFSFDRWIFRSIFFLEDRFEDRDWSPTLRESAYPFKDNFISNSYLCRKFAVYLSYIPRLSKRCWLTCGLSSRSRTRSRCVTRFVKLRAQDAY